MKILLLKYVLFIVLFFIASCGNAVSEKEKIDNKIKSEIKKATPVLVDNKKEEKATSPTTPKQSEKVATILTKTTVEPTLKTEKNQPTKTEPIIEKKAEKEKPVINKKTPKSVEVPIKEEMTTTEDKKEVKAETPKPVVTTPEPKEVTKPTPPAFSHEPWNKLLQKNVSGTGKVNYKGFKADKTPFDAYLKSLADNPVQSSQSKAEKMAYWINAYNAFTIKLIVDNYPISSITKLHGGKPWDAKWIKLGGKTYSLNNIENDILRPKYKDARIHFAVNCAANSCPPILNKAWTAKNLNSNLEKQAKLFINNPKYNTIAANKVVISKIFEWYAGDFDDIISYLNKYASVKIDAGAKVKYQEYNWALNE